MLSSVPNSQKDHDMPYRENMLHSGRSYIATGYKSVSQSTTYIKRFYEKQSQVGGRDT
jgi:hypothetical protein